MFPISNTQPFNKECVWPKGENYKKSICYFCGKERKHNYRDQHAAKAKVRQSTVA